MENTLQTSTNEHFVPVDKSLIRSMRFSRVVPSNNEALKSKLEYAMRLGNAHHVKVRLYFSTIEGNYKVETTVWACDNTSVCLKGGIWIPLSHIRSVEFY